MSDERMLCLTELTLWVAAMAFLFIRALCYATDHTNIAALSPAHTYSSRA